MFHIEKYIDSIILEGQKKLKLEEQAALIIMNERSAIEEKMQDLQALMNVYDGGELQICEDIKNVIQLWKDILEARFYQDGVVFLADLQERSRETDRLSAYRFFSTYQRALEFLLKEKEHYQISKDLSTIETYGEIWRMELDSDDPDFDVYCFDNEMKLNKLLSCSGRSQEASLQRFEKTYERLCEEVEIVEAKEVVIVNS